MKKSILLVGLVIALSLVSGAHAVEKVKKDNNDLLQATTSWVGGSVPGLSDVAVWDSTVSTPTNCSNTWSVGNMFWGGIKIMNPATNVYINFVVDASKPDIRGIDMSQATHDLTFGNNAATPWQPNIRGDINIATDRTFTINGSSWVQVSGAFSITNDGTFVTDIGATFIIGNATGTMTRGSFDVSGADFSLQWADRAGFLHSGGSVRVLGGQPLRIGRDATYNMSGGSLDLTGDLRIYNKSTYTNTIMNVTGGTINQTAGFFYLGYLDATAGGTCKYVQSGNSVVTCATLRVRGSGVVDMIISNGTFYASAFDELASQNGSTNHITLAGGTTTWPAFPTARGTACYADITFDGGTLKPRAASTTYICRD